MKPVSWTNNHTLAKIEVERTHKDNWNVHLINTQGSRFFHTAHRSVNSVLSRVDYLKERFPNIRSNELTAHLVAVQLEETL